MSECGGTKITGSGTAPAPLTLAGLVATARELGFQQPQAIGRLARSSAVLQFAEKGADATGSSKLGGQPSLPPSVAWPKRRKDSLAFIAQIELGTLPNVLAKEGFSLDGRLLFFYDTDRAPWGFDPKDAGGFAVIHLPGAAAVQASSAWPRDLRPQNRFEAVPLLAQETLTLPPWDSVTIEDLELSTEQLAIYQTLLGRTRGPEEWSQRVLFGGHPDQIQGDMALECAAVSTGRYWGAPYEGPGDDPWAQVFRKSARRWRLLLQVPSVERIGMMWGDAGCLYYWIREDDLNARRFERCWLILQCG